MRTLFKTGLVAFAVSLLTTAPAAAQDVGAALSSTALPDHELARIRGGAPVPTGSNFAAIEQAQASAFLRATGENTQIIMDNWWADVGATLILASIGR